MGGLLRQVCLVLGFTHWSGRDVLGRCIVKNESRTMYLALYVDGFSTVIMSCGMLHDCLISQYYGCFRFGVGFIGMRGRTRNILIRHSVAHEAD